MVEECNWKPECVQAWDNNTAVYPTLSEEEKEKVLAAKKKVDADRFNKEEEEKANREREDRERIDKETREKCEKLDPPFEMPKPEQHHDEEHHDDQNRNNGEQKPEEHKEEHKEEQKPEEHKQEHQQQDGWMLLQDTPDGENKVHKEVEPPHIAPIDPKPET
jgi:hypothetical protein